MRIFWQSFVDASVNAPYMASLSQYLNEIAAPGTTVHVEGISPPDREFGLGITERAESMLVLHLRFARNHIKPDAFDPRRRSGEISLNQRLVETEGFKHLCAAIALQRRDAHLRERFEQPLVDRLLVVLERRGERLTFGQIATLSVLLISIDTAMPRGFKRRPTSKASNMTVG